MLVAQFGAVVFIFRLLQSVHLPQAVDFSHGLPFGHFSLARLHHQPGHAAHVAFAHGVGIVRVLAEEVQFRIDVVRRGGAVQLRQLRFQHRAENPLVRHAERILPAALGGHHNHPVRRPGTVDGGCHAVLQHGDVLDVLGVDGLQPALDGVAVQHHQRLALRVERRDTADFDFPVLVEHHACRLPFQQGVQVGLQFRFQCFRRDDAERTRGAVLGDGLVAGDDDLLQVLRVRLHGHLVSRLSRLHRHLFRLHADESEDQHRLRSSRRHPERELAVHARRRAEGGSFHQDRHARHGHAFLVRHHAGKGHRFRRLGHCFPVFAGSLMHCTHLFRHAFQVLPLPLRIRPPGGIVRPELSPENAQQYRQTNESEFVHVLIRFRIYKKCLLSRQRYVKNFTFESSSIKN